MYIWYQDNTGLYIQKDIFESRLKETYTLKNLTKVKLLSRWEVWRARNLPDTYDIYTNHRQKELYQVPLGILWSKNWYQLIERHTSHPLYPVLPFTETLRENQMNAINLLKMMPSGIMNAGTGVGKSYMILYLASILKRRTLIMVNSTVTLKEMVTKCQQFLNITPIVVGGTKKYTPTSDHITIALIHSASKLHLFSYGAILADECDLYVSTEIRQKLWFHCSPDYLYWFSASLSVNMQEERLIHLFFWQAEQSLLTVGLTPRIKEVPTRYMYPGNLDSDKEFSKMQTDISENVARNTLIINTVYDTLTKTETKKGLLLVKRTEQAYVFKTMLEQRGIQSYIIIGETSEEDREKIRADATSTTEPVVLIGSAQILWRWFDMPPLQTIYLSYPQKFDSAVEQAVGRVLRKFPGKTYAQVYDFSDSFETALRNQFYHRKRVYKKKYWVVVN